MSLKSFGKMNSFNPYMTSPKYILAEFYGEFVL